MIEPYYRTHEPPHCPTCDCGGNSAEWQEHLRHAIEKQLVLAFQAGHRRNTFNFKAANNAIVAAAMNGANG